MQNKYNLTEGVTEKTYQKIINNVLTDLPDLTEWINPKILKKFKNISWKQSILKLHDPKNVEKYNENLILNKSFSLQKLNTLTIKFSRIIGSFSLPSSSVGIKGNLLVKALANIPAPCLTLLLPNSA